MILKIDELKDAASKILSAVDASNMQVVTETLELIAENKTLYLNVTNREYYVRVKMALDDDAITNESRIIILKLESNAPVGIIVDKVKEVVSLDERNIDVVNKNSSNKNDVSFISGVGKVDQGLISLLDLSTIISEKESV